MPVDPVIHQHMTYLVQTEKDARRRADGLEDEIALWKKRVRLAEERGLSDLADEARQRAKQRIAERREVGDKLKVIAAEKSRLRTQSRMPDGHEVERAQDILRRWQESGLVDPDEAVLERQFDDLDAQRALDEFDDPDRDDSDTGPPPSSDEQ